MDSMGTYISSKSSMMSVETAVVLVALVDDNDGPNVERSSVATESVTGSRVNVDTDWKLCCIGEFGMDLTSFGLKEVDCSDIAAVIDGGRNSEFAGEYECRWKIRRMLLKAVLTRQ